MESLSLEQGNIIKDIRRYLLRLNKEINYTAIKDIKNLIKKKLKRN